MFDKEQLMDMRLAAIQNGLPTRRTFLMLLDHVEALERENGAMIKVVEATDIEHQSGWPNHDRYSCDVCIGIHTLRRLKEGV